MKRIACPNGATTFDPSIASSPRLRRRHANIPLFAFTATATPRVRDDIINQLALHEPAIHVASFNRPNLYYAVRPKNKRTYDELLTRAKQDSSGHRLLPVAQTRR